MNKKHKEQQQIRIHQHTHTHTNANNWGERRRKNKRIYRLLIEPCVPLSPRGPGHAQHLKSLTPQNTAMMLRQNVFQCSLLFWTDRPFKLKSLRAHLGRYGMGYSRFWCNKWCSLDDVYNCIFDRMAVFGSNLLTFIRRIRFFWKKGYSQIQDQLIVHCFLFDVFRVLTMLMPMTSGRPMGLDLAMSCHRHGHMHRQEQGNWQCVVHKQKTPDLT